MYRGSSNPDYHRPASSEFGHHAPSFGPPRFCPPYGGPPGRGYCAPPPGPPPGHPYGTVNERYRESFYENRPFTSHTADQRVSSQLTPTNQHQPGHSSQNWSTQQLDDQNQEVRKKAEEFLRILEASNRNELTGDKNTTGDRSSEKQTSRARSRSRGKSRPRSRSRSRGRSRGHSRARSRCRGKSRPRSRSRSHSRAKSRTRAKSRPRSRSRSHSRGKSTTRAKSQPRQSHQSHKATTENNYSFTSTSGGPSLGSGAMPDVFYGLKNFLQSKELEKHLPLVKNALLRNQSADDTKGIMLGNQPAVRGFQSFEPSLEPGTSAGLNYGSLLPHERAGGNSSTFSNILSWNTYSQQPETKPETKPMFNSVEDEEKFLYGEEEERAKPQAVTVPLSQNISARSPVHQLVKESKAHSVQLAGSGTTKVTPEECEKLRSLLKAVGLNPGMADICKMAAKLKEKEEQGGVSSLSQLRPALEALQALSRASRSDDSRSNRSGSSHSNRDSKCEEKKMDEKERERREKQIHKKRKEYLVKELEGLLKQEGSGDLIPVIGFFCQRCEEFFGDLNSAEKHAASHGHTDKNQMGAKEQHSDAKRHQPSSHRRESAERSQEHSPDRKRIRDDKHSKTQSESEGKDSADKSKDKSRDKQKDDNDAELTKSERKKQKKEKKLKKKEKKKKKDKKKAEFDSP